MLQLERVSGRGFSLCVPPGSAAAGEGCWRLPAGGRVEVLLLALGDPRLRGLLPPGYLGGRGLSPEFALSTCVDVGCWLVSRQGGNRVDTLFAEQGARYLLLRLLTPDTPEPWEELQGVRALVLHSVRLDEREIGP